MVSNVNWTQALPIYLPVHIDHVTAWSNFIFHTLRFRLHHTVPPKLLPRAKSHSTASHANPKPKLLPDKSPLQVYHRSQACRDPKVATCSSDRRPTQPVRPSSVLQVLRFDFISIVKGAHACVCDCIGMLPRHLTSRVIGVLFFLIILGESESCQNKNISILPSAHYAGRLSGRTVATFRNSSPFAFTSA